MLSYQMLCPSSWAWCMRVRAVAIGVSLLSLLLSLAAARPRSIARCPDLVYPTRVALAAVERGGQPGVGDRQRVDSSTNVRAPRQSTLASLWAREILAASTFQASTARTPWILLAAMQTPMPVPQTSSPTAPVSPLTARPTAAA